MYRGIGDRPFSYAVHEFGANPRRRQASARDMPRVFRHSVRAAGVIAFLLRPPEPRFGNVRRRRVEACVYRLPSQAALHLRARSHRGIRLASLGCQKSSDREFFQQDQMIIRGTLPRESVRHAISPASFQAKSNSSSHQAGQIYPPAGPLLQAWMGPCGPSSFLASTSSYLELKVMRRVAHLSQSLSATSLDHFRIIANH